MSSSKQLFVAVFWLGVTYNLLLDREVFDSPIHLALRVGDMNWPREFPWKEKVS